MILEIIILERVVKRLLIIELSGRIIELAERRGMQFETSIINGSGFYERFRWKSRKRDPFARVRVRSK